MLFAFSSMYSSVQRKIRPVNPKDRIDMIALEGLGLYDNNKRFPAGSYIAKPSLLPVLSRSTQKRICRLAAEASAFGIYFVYFTSVPYSHKPQAKDCMGDCVSSFKNMQIS